MGCDIHFYVEKKNKAGTKWVSADVWEKDDNYVHVPYEKRYYSGRNYNLFAILADVRNGSGFAGCKTGEGFNPISQPKGLPDDVSKEMKQASEGMGGDGHSHSWFTLRELLDYDWTQTTKLQGWCDFKTWETWSRWDRAHGLGPESYCGGVEGREVAHISPGAMDLLCTRYRELPRGDEDARKAMEKEHASTYALAEWKTPYYRAAGSFMDETILRLLKLAGGIKGVDDVRIVFFFDN
jgi:hypothetical protein